MKNGRVTLKIKLIDESRFKSAYGGANCYCLYEKEDGGMCKYVGSSPPEISDKKFEEVIATLRSEKGKLLRIMNVKKN